MAIDKFPSFPDVNSNDLKKMLINAIGFIENIKGIPYDFNGSLSLENKFTILFQTVVDLFNKNEELIDSYKELYDFTYDYFNNLDVQKEIDIKLDEMAKNGTLYEIIEKYTTPIINEQNNKINVLEHRMNEFTSLPNGSTSGDAELIDIRVGYNGKTYSTAGDAVRKQISNTMNNNENIITSENFPTILPDVNNAKTTNIIYRLNFANGVEDYPINMPEGFPNGQVWTLMVIKGNANINENGIVQLAFSNIGVFMRWTITSGWSKWLKIGEANSNLIYPNIIDNLIDANNYETVLPDVNNAKNNNIYRLNFANNTNDFPLNMPIVFPDGQIWVLVCIQGNSTTSGITQILFSRYKIYIRWTTNNGWSEWFAIGTNGNENNVVYVKKDYLSTDKTHFNNLCKAIITSTQNTTIYVDDGTYDILEELKEIYGNDFIENNSTYAGLVLQNNIHIIFSSNSKVICNYSGNNNYMKRSFSPFNSGPGGFTIENLTLEASNCRYAIHDERGNSEDSYRNIYKNCNIKFDTRKNDVWKSPQCIGGGLGKNGEIVIENCIFESISNDNIESSAGAVSYHNTSIANAKSHLVMTGCYIKGKGCARFSYYGTSTEITNILVHNNSFGSNIVIRAETEDGTSPINNIEVISFNNIVRD